MTKSVIASILFAGAIVGLSIFFSAAGNKSPASLSVANVSMSGEKQIVEITAKGGYTPARTGAKAGVPTALRIKTAGTFDCSSVLSIPALGVRQNLPLQGVTDIEVPPQPSGTELLGTCGMGMYRFSILFS